LGALLLEPVRIRDVHELLRPEHMYRPAHAALFRVLLEQPPHPPGKHAALADRTMALIHATTAHTAGITPAYAHTLMAACPHPRNAVAYARMILDAADHRTIAVHAIRLAQVAAADRDRGGLQDTLTHHRALHTALDELAHRWGRPSRDPSPNRVVHTAPPDRPSPRDAADEQALVAALIADPRPLDEIRRLHPTDFADPTHAALYQCVGALTHRGEPVDPLTVLWEAQRRGHLHGDRDPELFLRICASAGPGSADHWAERVLRASILRTATTTAGAVRTLAEDGTVAAYALATAARESLAPLDAVRERWHTTRRKDPPRTPPAAHGPPDNASTVAARAHTTTAINATKATRPAPTPTRGTPVNRNGPRAGTRT